jgi:Na+/melibiose symporter-like transporter
MSPPVSPSTLAAAKTGFAYGAGQVTISVFFQVTSLLLLPFMTNMLAIPAAIAGLVIMLPKVSAMVLDPLVGMLSDRIPPRWQVRRPLLVIGGVTTALAFPMLFNPPSVSNPVVLATYIFAGFLLANAALSCLTVSYLASAFDIAGEPSQRTVLMSWRVAFHMGGVLLGGLAPAAVAFLGTGRSGYALMGVALCGFCLCAVAVNYLSTVRVPLRRAAAGYAKPRDLWLVLRRKSSFRHLAAIYGIKYFSNGIQYAANAYFVLYVLEGELQLLSAMVVTMTLAALATQPLWVKLAARIGKINTFVIATVGIGTAFLSFATLGPGDDQAAIVISAFQGVFAGGGALMSWSLFVDSIQLYAEQTGESRPELLAGVWSAIEKVLFAIGVFVFGGILQLLGLVPSTQLIVTQPDSALLGVRLGVAVLPALGMALTVAMIWAWLRNTRLGPAPAVVKVAGPVGE